MNEIWKSFEKVVEYPYLRVSIYILTFISGVTYFITSSLVAVALFLVLLGFLTVFETIHPKGNITMVKAYIPGFIPKNVKRVMLICIKSFLIAVGMFVMFIGIMAFRFH